VVLLGVGAVVIGGILNRINAKGSLYAVATITYIVAILMAPFAWVLKGILIAAVVLVFAFFLWGNREALVKAS